MELYELFIVFETIYVLFTVIRRLCEPIYCKAQLQPKRAIVTTQPKLSRFVTASSRDASRDCAFATPTLQFANNRPIAMFMNCIVTAELSKV